MGPLPVPSAAAPAAAVDVLTALREGAAREAAALREQIERNNEELERLRGLDEASQKEKDELHERILEANREGNPALIAELRRQLESKEKVVAENPARIAAAERRLATDTLEADAAVEREKGLNGQIRALEQERNEARAAAAAATAAQAAAEAAATAAAREADEARAAKAAAEAAARVAAEALAANTAAQTAAAQAAASGQGAAQAAAAAAADATAAQLREAEERAQRATEAATQARAAAEAATAASARATADAAAARAASDAQIADAAAAATLALGEAKAAADAAIAEEKIKTAALTAELDASKAAAKAAAEAAARSTSGSSEQLAEALARTKELEAEIALKEAAAKREADDFEKLEAAIQAQTAIARSAIASKDEALAATKTSLAAAKEALDKANAELLQLKTGQTGLNATDLTHFINLILTTDIRPPLPFRFTTNDDKKLKTLPQEQQEIIATLAKFIDKVKAVETCPKYNVISNLGKGAVTNYIRLNEYMARYYSFPPFCFRDQNMGTGEISLLKSGKDDRYQYEYQPQATWTHNVVYGKTPDGTIAHFKNHIENVINILYNNLEGNMSLRKRAFIADGLNETINHDFIPGFTAKKYAGIFAPVDSDAKPVMSPKKSAKTGFFWKIEPRKELLAKIAVQGIVNAYDFTQAKEGVVPEEAKKLEELTKKKIDAEGALTWYTSHKSEGTETSFLSSANHSLVSHPQAAPSAAPSAATSQGRTYEDYLKDQKIAATGSAESAAAQARITADRDNHPDWYSRLLTEKPLEDLRQTLQTDIVILMDKIQLQLDRKRTTTSIQNPKPANSAKISELSAHIIKLKEFLSQSTSSTTIDDLTRIKREFTNYVINTIQDQTLTDFLRDLRTDKRNSIIKRYPVMTIKDKPSTLVLKGGSKTRKLKKRSKKITQKRR